MTTIPNPESAALRSEDCVCGGTLTIFEDTAEAIRSAVDLHQQSLPHQRWRYGALQGLKRRCLCKPANSRR